MTTDSIAARFGGVDITFKIDRSDLQTFEALFGPAVALWRRIGQGDWKISEIKDVLRFASSPNSRSNLPIELFGSFGWDHVNRNDKSDLINETFARNPPARYAPLAFQILDACLFGVNESEATFSDEEEIVAA